VNSRRSALALLPAYPARALLAPRVQKGEAWAATATGRNRATLARASLLIPSIWIFPVSYVLVARRPRPSRLITQLNLPRP